MPFLTQGKTNWKFFLIVVILGVIVGGGIIFWAVEQPNFYKAKEDKITSDPLEKALEIKDYKFCLNANEPNTCLRAIARITANSEICKKITDKEKSEKCIALIAGDAKNYDLCNSITDSDIKNYCQKLLATQMLDGNICKDIANDLVPYPKDKCFFDIAVAKKDIDLCEKSGDLEDPCYYQVAISNQSVETCTLIKDDKLKDFCFFYNSVHTSQVRPCREIKREPLTTLCPALASLNPYYCELIQDYRVKNLCRQQIALETNNSELCKGDRTCITKIASRTHSPELCENISVEQYKLDCKITVATVNNDEFLCSVLDKKSKEYCFYYLALKTADPAYCDNIEDKESSAVSHIMLDIFGTGRGHEITRSYCLRQLAGYKPDIDICDYISYDNERRNCRIHALSDVIKINKDPQLCETLEEDYDKTNCYYYTAINTSDYQLCKKIGEIRFEFSPGGLFWRGKQQSCYEQTLSDYEEEYFRTHGYIQEPAEMEEKPDDPIVFTVKQGDTVSQLAEKALNIFLSDMTNVESEEINFEITLGHRIYIEDYLARQVKPEGYIYPGDKIFFPRKLIVEAIRFSDKLTKEQLKDISRYSISILEPAFDILQNGYLSYCHFRKELSYYYRIEDKELDHIICQITLTGDFSFCEHVTEQVPRRRCYKWITKNTSNYKVCENFEKHNKNFCYYNFAEVLNNVDICYNIDTIPSRDSCLTSIARNNPDPSICELMEDKGTCYGFVALDRGDASFCEKITHANKRTWCLINLSRKLHDVSLCERIKEDRSIDTENFKYNCYIGYYNDNVHLFRRDNCDELSGFQRDYCYLKKASLDGDLEKCSKIETKEIKDYCIYKSLVLKNNPLCELIEFWDYRNQCYSKVAQSTQDYLLCTKIFNNDYMMGECLTEIANSSGDKKPCELLPKDSIFKTRCLQ